MHRFLPGPAKALYLPPQRFVALDPLLGRLPANAAAENVLADAGDRIDVVGDVHGCLDELRTLLEALGWTVRDPDEGASMDVRHADPARRLVLLGDLVSRGPRCLDCLRLGMGLTQSGRGVALMGNHDWQLLALLAGILEAPPESGIMDHVLAEIAAAPAALRARLVAWLRRRPDRVAIATPVLGPTVFVHAAPDWAADLLEVDAPEPHTAHALVRLYGVNITAADGRARALDWRATRPEAAWTVFGHCILPRPTVVGRSLALDTGQGLGGYLSALRLDAVRDGDPLTGCCQAERAHGPGRTPTLQSP